MASIMTTPDLDAIVSEIYVAAPPARVFQALIDRQQVLQWTANEFCENVAWEFDARLGGRWRWIVREHNPSGRYKVDLFEHWGEVLEFDPPRLLVYTWYTNFHEPPSARTVVRWELTPAGAGTQLKMTHSGLANLPVPRADYSQGWPGLLEAIRDFCTK